MASRRRGARGNGLDAWPGYVDALSTLLMVIIFVLLVFVLAQAFLSAALTGRQSALDRLTREMSQLSELLSMEKAKTHDLQLNVASLGVQHDKDAAVSAALGAQLGSQTRLASNAQDQVSLLNQQLAELQKQLEAITAALDISQKDLKTSDAKVADLGTKLNLALADKVEELKRYRSEFFGRLSALLAHRPGIRVVGDRFVFQSEVLFPPGSAELSPAGQEQMKTLAKTLKQIAGEIPADLPWILRVDGHADRQPITGKQFPTNWELSAARAITVVKLLIAEGVKPQNLAATAFSQYQPLDAGNTPDAFAHNRRIELRLTDR